VVVQSGVMWWREADYLSSYHSLPDRQQLSSLLFSEPEARSPLGLLYQISATANSALALCCRPELPLHSMMFDCLFGTTQKKRKQLPTILDEAEIYLEAESPGCAHRA
jgi:hypothetical protein